MFYYDKNGMITMELQDNFHWSDGIVVGRNTILLSIMKIATAILINIPKYTD